MTMTPLGDWLYSIEESKNAPLLNLTIKNVLENKTVMITDINWAIGREDFIEHSYNTAIDTLAEGENCCLEGKVVMIEDGI